MMYCRIATLRCLCAAHVVLLLVLAPLAIVAQADPQASIDVERPDYETIQQHVVQAHIPPASNPFSEPSYASPTTSNTFRVPTHAIAGSNILYDLHAALKTMQERYFALWLGKWTTANDWTGAVLGTYVSATLSSLSRSIEYNMPGTFDKSRKLDVESQMVENTINKYYSQTLSYYFGEDHFAIRMQAFDDMLWVVLGWLEATQFIEDHSSSHHMPETVNEERQARGGQWHARQFIPAFAHRARIFFELAEKGWDWRLCGGGMTWNSRLLPYKNAITNQLFISASINMYLHFPGDENCSPFLLNSDNHTIQVEELYSQCDEYARGRYDPAYRASAINGYHWLKNSGMINHQGLYTDGFHISGYRQNHSKTTCDERNEMVYTYNQGVILTGLRGLWEATGNTSYLEDGHTLVRNVIRATGWTTSPLNSQHTRANDMATETTPLPLNWAGLGTAGILTELCDPSARCSQDSQSFKGIFFHHLSAFCTPLPARPVRAGRTYAASRETAMLHRRSCDAYAQWVVHNAQAALRTRDQHGRFGSWWGAPLAADKKRAAGAEEGLPGADERLPDGAVDYRNGAAGEEGEYARTKGERDVDHDKHARVKRDVNDRGRGRTVETQGSGLAVVRAMHEFVRRAEGSVDFDV